MLEFAPNTTLLEMLCCYAIFGLLVIFVISKLLKSVNSLFGNKQRGLPASTINVPMPPTETPFADSINYSALVNHYADIERSFHEGKVEDIHYGPHRFRKPNIFSGSDAVMSECACGAYLLGISENGSFYPGPNPLSNPAQCPRNPLSL